MRSGLFLAGVPREMTADGTLVRGPIAPPRDWVPLGAERPGASTRGIAEYWPVPLTPCRRPERRR